MNNDIWTEALNQIDQKYIYRAVESYRDGYLKDNAVKVTFRGKTAVNPKKRSRIPSVMFSFVAIAVLVVGLYLIFDYAVKNKVNVDTGDNTSVTTPDNESAPTVATSNEPVIFDKDDNSLNIFITDITFDEVEFQDKEGRLVYSGYSSDGNSRFFVTGQYANGTNSVPYYEDNSEIISVYDENGSYIASYSPDKSISECIENSFFYTISYTKKGIALIKHFFNKSVEARYYTVSFYDDGLNLMNEVSIPATFNSNNDIQLSSNGKYAMVYDAEDIYIYNIEDNGSLVNRIHYRDLLGENLSGSLIMPRISDDGENILTEAYFLHDNTEEIGEDNPTTAIQARQVVVDGKNCYIESITPSDLVVYWEGKYISIYSGEESRFGYLLTDNNFLGDIKLVERTPINELESNLYSEGKLYRGDNSTVILSPTIEGYMEEEYLYSRDSLVEIPGFGEYTDDNVFSVYPVYTGSNNNAGRLCIVNITSEKAEIDSTDITHNVKLYDDCIITLSGAGKLNITDFNGTITKTMPLKKSQYIELASVSENREYLLVVTCDSDNDRRNIRIYKGKQKYDELVYETQYIGISCAEINNSGTVLFVDETGERFVMPYIDEKYSIKRSDEGIEVYFTIAESDFSQPSISLSTMKSPGIYIVAATNNDFFAVNPEMQYIIKFNNMEMQTELYSPIIPEGNELSDYRFLFNGNRPIAIKKELNDDGVYDYYVLSFDFNMMLAKKGALHIPDSFFDFDNARVSSDGKYLIDIHYNIHYDSESYIRIYSLENYELYAEIKDLWKSIGEFSIDEVIEARVSNDGNKLFIITEGMSASNDNFSDESMVTYASVIDIESGIVSKSMPLSGDGKIYKTLQYSGGIAVFTDKALSLCNEDRVQSCPLPTEIADIKNCAISKNGKYIVILTTEDNIYGYKLIAEDNEAISLEICEACEIGPLYFGEIGAISLNNLGSICYNDINKNLGGPKVCNSILY